MIAVETALPGRILLMIQRSFVESSTPAFDYGAPRGSEPLIRPWLDDAPLALAALYLLVPLVLWVGFVRNHRQLESRILHRGPVPEARCRYRTMCMVPMQSCLGNNDAWVRSRRRL